MPRPPSQPDHPIAGAVRAARAYSGMSRKQVGDIAGDIPRGVASEYGRVFMSRIPDTSD